MSVMVLRSGCRVSKSKRSVLAGDDARCTTVSLESGSQATRGRFLSLHTSSGFFHFAGTEGASETEARFLAGNPNSIGSHREPFDDFEKDGSEAMIANFCGLLSAAWRWCHMEGVNHSRSADTSIYPVLWGEGRYEEPRTQSNIMMCNANTYHKSLVIGRLEESKNFIYSSARGLAIALLCFTQLKISMLHSSGGFDAFFPPFRRQHSGYIHCLSYSDSQINNRYSYSTQEQKVCGTGE